MTQIRSYLTPQNMKRVKDAANGLLIDIDSFESIFKCLDFSNYFVGYKTEEDLVQAAITQDKELPITLSCMTIIYHQFLQSCKLNK